MILKKVRSSFVVPKMLWRRAGSCDEVREPMIHPADGDEVSNRHPAGDSQAHLNVAPLPSHLQRGYYSHPGETRGSAAVAFGVQMTEHGDTQSDLIERSLIEAVVENWRLLRLFERVLDRLDAGEQARYARQLRPFQKRLADLLEVAGYKLVSLEGLPFDTGTAASAVNLAEFGPDDTLIVDQMVEPIVMGANGLRRQGTVTVRRAQL